MLDIGDYSINTPIIQEEVASATLQGAQRQATALDCVGTATTDGGACAEVIVQGGEQCQTTAHYPLCPDSLQWFWY